MGAFQCVPEVYQTDGLKGFYRKMSASYAGISETVIHFAIYENIKQLPNTEGFIQSLLITMYIVILELLAMYWLIFLDCVFPAECCLFPA